MKLFILLILFSIQIVVKSQFINFEGPFKGESEHICTKTPPFLKGVGYSIPVDSCLNYGILVSNFSGSSSTSASNQNSDSSNSGSISGSSYDTSSFNSSSSSNSGSSFDPNSDSVYSNFYFTYNIDNGDVSIFQYRSNDTTCSNSTYDIVSSNTYDSYECIPTPDFQGTNSTTFSQLSVTKKPVYSKNTIVIEQYRGNNDYRCHNFEELLFSITYTNGYEFVDSNNNLISTYFCKNGQAYLNACQSNGKCSDQLIETNCVDNKNIFCSV